MIYITDKWIHYNFYLHIFYKKALIKPQKEIKTDTNRLEDHLKFGLRHVKL